MHGSKLATRDRGRNYPYSLLEVEAQGLLGRNSLMQLRLDWEEICYAQHDLHSLASLLQKHHTLFEEELGKLIGTGQRSMYYLMHCPASISLGLFPLALKDKVEGELERLQKEGIIEAVKFSELVYSSHSSGG